MLQRVRRLRWDDRSVRRRLVQLTAAGVVVGGVMTTTASSVQAAPEQVLQAVRVSLGSDGTVSGISSTAIRRSADATSSDRTDLDPADVAAQLPVRIQTTYRLGDRAGTDLGDLEGKSGRAVVELTVQNLTARPETVTTSSGAEQTVLVGTPMTVVASADLGSAGLSRVVTTAGAGEPVTDGVLGTSTGRAVVQWAAMLVPPRLAPTATFRLVLEGDDLSAPTFDVSVQPRLVTDTSVQELLTSAFSGDDPSSTVSLEKQTVEKIAAVNAALTDAGTVLAEVQQKLDGSAGSLGRQTFQTLAASTSSLQSQLEAVGGQLDTTQTSLAGRLTGTRDGLSRQLAEAVTSVKAVLGDPEHTAPPTDALLTKGACADVALPAYPKAAQPTLTVYQHVLQANAQLGALVSASTSCSLTIRNQLAAAIGTAPADPAACQDQPSAMCALVNAGTLLDASFVKLKGQKDSIKGAYDPQWLTQLAARLSAFDAQAALVDGAIAGFDGSPQRSGIKQVGKDLDDLQRLVTSLQGAVDGLDLTDVYAGLDSIAQVATTQHDALAARADTLTLVGDLTARFCDQADQADQASVPPAISDIAASVGITLGACATETKAQVDGLVADVASSVTAWDDVRGTAGNVPSRTGVERELTAFSDGLSQTLTDIARIRTALGSSAGNLQDQLDALSADLHALVADAGDVSGSVGNLQDEALKMAGLVDAAFGDVEQGGTSTTTSLQREQADLAAARDAAQDRIGGLAADLGAIQSHGSTVDGNTKAALTASRAALDRNLRLLSASLGSSVQGAVDAIARQLGDSGRDVVTTEQQLTAQLRAVLTDIGNPDAGDQGLIGALRSNANLTDSQVQALAATRGDAASFGTVRSLGLDQVELRGKQLSLALSRQAEFPAFAMDLPTGSSVLTVFSFHLEG